MARRKRIIRRKMERGECILLLVAGLFFGTVFTFGMGYWNAPLTQDETIPVTAAYSGYDLQYGGQQRGMTRRVRQVRLLFTDHVGLTIDGSCVDDSLLNALSALSEGTPLDMLLHPNGDAVLSIAAPSGTLLAFDDAMHALTYERWGFFALGMLMYAGAAVGAFFLLTRRIY